MWKAETEIMNFRRELSEINLGKEIQGRENFGLQNWGDIKEK